MREANQLTKDNAVASDRPWIGPIQENIDPLVGGKKPNLVMILNNFGHSPAVEVETKMSTAIVPIGWLNAKNLTDFIQNTAKATKIGTWFPNQIAKADVPTFTVTLDQMRTIDAGTADFIMLGLVLYKDTARQIEHHTWLFATYAPDKKILMIQKSLELPIDD
jgi:hypothetical protein